MLFSQITFLLYFLPFFLVSYYLLPCKNIIVLIASLIFYAWGEPRFIPILIFSTLLNYIFGYLVDVSVNQRRYYYLLFGIAINLGLLIFYKYTIFIAGVLIDVLPSFSSINLIPEITLPLGISFFTFQGMSYLIDVYRKDVAAQKSFLKFATYKTLFPQLIAGPIVRYSDISNDIDNRPITNRHIYLGFKFFAIGLMQKVLIANTVAYPADQIFSAEISQISIYTAWYGAACYTIQIYYDFAGYSNMAIGIAHMIGFSFPINFNQPYSATSITDFWRRWHITLSQWFRDYLYIPLGGNRISEYRTYLNLLLVFILCGLWHGAAWTFLIWGIWHGLFLVIERKGLGKVLQRLPKAISPLGQIYTMLVVMVGWIFFRSDNLTYAIKFLGVMFGIIEMPHSLLMDTLIPPALEGGTPLAVPILLNNETLSALILGFLFALWRPNNSTMAQQLFFYFHSIFPLPHSTRFLLLILFLSTGIIFSIASISAGTYNPFIYYRF